jgi:hypothetical protein
MLSDRNAAFYRKGLGMVKAEVEKGIGGEHALAKRRLIVFDVDVDVEGSACGCGCGCWMLDVG